MRTFQVIITGKTESDAADALAEVARLIEEGFTSGANRNEAGSFSFDSSGEFDGDDQSEDQ